MARCGDCGGVGCATCNGSGSTLLAAGYDSDGDMDGIINPLINPGNQQYLPGPHPTNWSAQEGGQGTRESQPNGSVHPMTVGSRSGLDQVGAGSAQTDQDQGDPRRAAAAEVRAHEKVVAKGRRMKG